MWIALVNSIAMCACVPRVGTKPELVVGAASLTGSHFASDLGSTPCGDNALVLVHVDRCERTLRAKVAAIDSQNTDVSYI